MVARSAAVGGAAIFSLENGEPRGVDGLSGRWRCQQREQAEAQDHGHPAASA